MRNLILCLSFSLFSSVSIASEYPIVIDPMATATPPGAKVSAGYMSLKNDSDEAILITDTYSPSIPKVEIHLSTMVDDVAKMEKQDSLEIKPGETLTLEHGGYHFMLMGLTKPLVDGETVDIILVTSAGEMLIELPINKIDAVMAKHGMDKHDMTKHGKVESENEAAHSLMSDKELQKLHQSKVDKN